MTWCSTRRSRRPRTRTYSFTVRPIDPVGKAFKGGIGFEFAEYLKGETHYIVVTIKKKSLLGTASSVR